jgi:H+/Na+-translocating ferredoxin:NAD+ oxidoreductase subunit B
MSDVYTRLREFMDKMPVGFPETPTGVEIKILKKLYTPEEAELTMQLKNEPEEVPAIAKRIGMDEKTMAAKLEDMAQKGLIYRVRAGDKRLYQAFQFIVGVYEFQLKHLDREFCELFEEYLPYIGMNIASVQTQQLRVVPVESAVGTGKGVARYNQVRELVKQQKVLCVQECICRKEQELLGHPCDKPKEICLNFGDLARFTIDNHAGRQIDVEECVRLLDKAEEAGLVLQPSNTEELQWICCCCSCCCPGLKIAKSTPRPQDLIRSYYQARIDPDECTACGDCIERCPMDAIREGDNVSEVIEGRCIGCGLCVSVCPVEAISLVPKPGMEAPPRDVSEMLNRIAAERGVA